MTRKPKVGDRIRWPYWRPGITGCVTLVHDNGIARYRLDTQRAGSADGAFIWCHPEGLNTECEIVEDAQS